MTSSAQYEIVPLSDGEHSHKVASILANKYKVTAKRVTMNERFGVLEKGYMLHAKEPAEKKRVSNVYLVVHDKNLISKKEFIENYLAKNPIVEAAEIGIEEDKENGPTKEPNTETFTKKEFTTDDYVRDITRSILKAI